MLGTWKATKESETNDPRNNRLSMRLSYPCRYRIRDTLALIWKGWTMIKQYGLVAPSNMRPLNLPAMTLAQAETARDKLAAMGKAVFVINLKAE